MNSHLLSADPAVDEQYSRGYWGAKQNGKILSALSEQLLKCISRDGKYRHADLRELFTVVEPVTLSVTQSGENHLVSEHNAVWRRIWGPEVSQVARELQGIGLRNVHVTSRLNPFGKKESREQPCASYFLEFHPGGDCIVRVWVATEAVPEWVENS